MDADLIYNYAALYRSVFFGEPADLALREVGLAEGGITVAKKYPTIAGAAQVLYSACGLSTYEISAALHVGRQVVTKAIKYNLCLVGPRKRGKRKNE